MAGRNTFEIRSTGDDWDAVQAVLEKAFAESWSPDAVETGRLVFEPARSFGAFAGDELVGHTCTYSLPMTVPGGPLGVAGVSMVGVLPTYRRQGVLRTMMRHHLTALHETGGEPVAALTASEPAIYGRFGYGLATDQAALEIPREHSALRPVAGVDEVSVRYAEPGKVLDACAAVRHSVVAKRPGMFRHDDRWRRHEIADPESSRRGASPLRCVVAERGGEITGYAYFRTRGSWDARGPDGTTEVQQVHATGVASYAALWRFLLDQDLMATTKHWFVVPDDQIVTLLVDVRRALLRLRDGMWVRLVDVGRALGSRTYAGPVDVVLEVRDELCPWNAGRWHLAGDASGASCGKVGREPDLVLDVRELGGVYLGRPSLTAVGAAGLVEERTPGSLAAASQAFRHDPLPWCDRPF